MIKNVHYKFIRSPMLQIHDMPNKADVLEKELNAIIKIKLKKDYEKLFIIREIYLRHDLPKEIVWITFKMVYSVTMINAGTNNIVVNTYESHIFCKELCDMAIDINKMIPSRVKQLFIEDRYIISLDMNGEVYFISLDMNGELYSWNSHEYEKIVISKNIQYICQYYDGSTNFFLQSFSPNNLVRQIRMNEPIGSHYLDYDEDEIINENLPYEMISCGSCHIIYLLKDGTVNAEGYNTNGQLCLGHDHHVGDDTMLVNLNSKISQVCCCQYSTILKTVDNELLIYGDFCTGYDIPLINSYGKNQIIRCSDSYIVTLSDNDRIHVWDRYWYAEIIGMNKIIEIVCYSAYIILISHDETIRVVSLSTLVKLNDENSEDDS